MPQSSNPYEVFDRVENTIGASSVDRTPKERSLFIWTYLSKIWKRDRTKADLKSDLRLAKAILSLLSDACLADQYLKCSRARWLCTLMSACRLHCGLVAAMLYGSRRHVALLLRIAPLEIYLAATFVSQNGGCWQSKNLPFLANYITRTLR